MSEGNPISWGSSSIVESPDLLVRVVSTSGLNMNSLSLCIDQKLSCGNCVSKNMSVLSVRRVGQLVMK